MGVAFSRPAHFRPASAAPAGGRCSCSLREVPLALPQPPPPWPRRRRHQHAAAPRQLQRQLPSAGRVPRRAGGTRRGVLGSSWSVGSKTSDCRRHPCEALSCLAHAPPSPPPFSPPLDWVRVLPATAIAAATTTAAAAPLPPPPQTSPTSLSSPPGSASAASTLSALCRRWHMHVRVDAHAHSPAAGMLTLPAVPPPRPGARVGWRCRVRCGHPASWCPCRRPPPAGPRPRPGGLGGWR